MGRRQEFDCGRSAFACFLRRAEGDERYERDGPDGVAQGGVPDDIVPVFDGDLAGDDGGGATMAIIEDLQKVAPFGRIEYRQPPIVKDQELNAAERFEQAAIATVAASKGERLEQARTR